MLKLKTWMIIFGCLGIALIITGDCIPDLPHSMENFWHNLYSEVDKMGWMFIGVIIGFYALCRYKVIDYNDKFHWRENSPKGVIKYKDDK